MKLDVIIFGGAFNPPHLGHLNVAKLAMEKLKPEELIFLPSGNSPHKGRPGLSAGGHDRIKMLELVTRDINGFKVDDREVRRSGISYSILTLREYEKELGGKNLGFIMGTDMLLSFESWYEFKEILSLCALIAVCREGSQQDEIKAAAEELKRKYNARIILLEIPPMPMSSSEIREKIKNGENLENYLDREVIYYIKENGLYI